MGPLIGRGFIQPPDWLLAVAAPVLLDNVKTLPDPRSDDLWAALGDEGSTASGDSDADSDTDSESEVVDPLDDNGRLEAVLNNEPDLWAAVGDGGDSGSDQESETPGDSHDESVRWHGAAVADLIVGVNRAILEERPAIDKRNGLRRRWSESAMHDPFATPQALLETGGKHDVWAQTAPLKRWSQDSQATSLRLHGLGVLFAPPAQAEQPPAQPRSPPKPGAKTPPQKPPRPGHVRSHSLLSVARQRATSIGVSNHPNIPYQRVVAMVCGYVHSIIAARTTLSLASMTCRERV